MTDNRPPLTSRNPRPAAATPTTYPEVGRPAAALFLTFAELKAFVADCEALRVPDDAQLKVRTRKLDRIRHISAAAPR